MTPRSPKKSLFSRFLIRLSASSFFTFSLFLHLIFVMAVGGVVLFKVNQPAPDFVAGSEGLLADSADSSPSPDSVEIQIPTEQITPPAPTPDALPQSALVTVATVASTWSLTSLPNASLGNVSESMKSSMTALTGGGATGSGQPGLGRMGRLGATKTGTIFGKKILAAKLGVILDVSGSGHPFLADAITEIQKSFSDAIIILYPGCGMIPAKGSRPHEVRKLSTIPRKEIEKAASNFTTPAQLAKALKVPAFEKLIGKASVRDTLFVSWHDGDPSAKGAAELIGHTPVAFEYLTNLGVDTIYWFADFQDGVNPAVADQLGADLQSRNIKLYVHNFAGAKTRPEIVRLAEMSGGTADSKAAK